MEGGALSPPDDSAKQMYDDAIKGIEASDIITGKYSIGLYRLITPII